MKRLGLLCCCCCYCLQHTNLQAKTLFPITPLLYESHKNSKQPKHSHKNIIFIQTCYSPVSYLFLDLRIYSVHILKTQHAKLVIWKAITCNSSCFIIEEMLLIYLLHQLTSLYSNCFQFLRPGFTRFQIQILEQFLPKEQSGAQFLFCFV